MVNVPRVPIFRSLKHSCIHSFVIHHLSGGEKIPRERSLYRGRGGGGTFAGYVPLASQSPYPTIVYSVFMDPILVIFGQICNFRDPNLATFYFYELNHFLD